MYVFKINRCCVKEWVVMVNHSCIYWYCIHTVLLSLLLLKKFIPVDCTTLIRWLKISTICHSCALMPFSLLIQRSSCSGERIMSSEGWFVHLSHGHCHVWCRYKKGSMNWCWRVNARFIMFSRRKFRHMFRVYRLCNLSNMFVLLYISKI